VSVINRWSVVYDITGDAQTLALSKKLSKTLLCRRHPMPKRLRAKMLPRDASSRRKSRRRSRSRNRKRHLKVQCAGKSSALKGVSESTSLVKGLGRGKGCAGR
jgi:hypothetical protein